MSPPCTPAAGLRRGERTGNRGWHAVTQAEVDAFADATGDHPWIHVDPERNKESLSRAYTG